MKTATLILGSLISISAFADMHQNSLKFVPAAVVDFPVNVKVGDSFTPVPLRAALGAVGKGLGTELTTGNAGDNKATATYQVSAPIPKAAESKPDSKSGSSAAAESPAPATPQQDAGVPQQDPQGQVNQAQIDDLNNRIQNLQNQLNNQPNNAQLQKELETVKKQRDTLASISAFEREIAALKSDDKKTDAQKLQELAVLQSALKGLQDSKDQDIKGVLGKESGRLSKISSDLTKELSDTTKRVNDAAAAAKAAKEAKEKPA